MPIDQFITDRLAAIEARPAMWGSTRTEIGLQIALLVEVWHVAHGCAFDPALIMRAVFGPGAACERPVDDDWVSRAIETARGMTVERKEPA